METQNNQNPQQPNPQSSEAQQYYVYGSDPVPQEVKKWNWGAFMFNIWWGIGNKVYLPLLCLIPLFNIVWIFVCGAKGNEWVWKTGEYTSPEELKKCQSTWSRAGLVCFIVTAVCMVLYFIFFASIIGAVIHEIQYGDLANGYYQYGEGYDL